MVSSTCPPVSVCGTVTHYSPHPAFRACSGVTALSQPKLQLVLASRSTASGICLGDLPTSVNGARLAARHPPQGSGCVQTCSVWSLNINSVSIAYGSRPRLRPDYPAAECPCGGTLRLSVGGILAPLIVTHTDIRTCGRSMGCASAPTSPPPQRSPTTALAGHSALRWWT